MAAPHGGSATASLLPARPVPPPAEPVVLQPIRPTVDTLDEDAMKALVRVHLAQVEAELRANTVASLEIARRRARAMPPVRLAAR